MTTGDVAHACERAGSIRKWGERGGGVCALAASGVPAAGDDIQSCMPCNFLATPFVDVSKIVDGHTKERNTHTSVVFYT